MNKLIKNPNLIPTVMIDQFSRTLDIMEELLSQDYQMTQLIILRNPFIQKPFGSFSLKIESKYGLTILTVRPNFMPNNKIR